MRIMSRASACLLLGLMAWETCAAAGLSALRDITDQRGGLDDRRFAALVDRVYADLKASGADGVGREPSASFEAAYLALFYSPKSAHLEDLQRAFAGLESQGAPTDAQIENLHVSLVRMRRFDAADALAARHPEAGLEPLPGRSPVTELPPGQRLAWRVEAGTDSQRLQAVGLPAPSDGILVSSHPHCGPSQRAAEAIAADPQLAALFARHATLLVHQAGRFAAAEEGAWRPGGVTLPLNWVHREADWPEVDSWATPVFYFLRDGQVVATVSGWSKEGQREALLAAADQAGLIPE
ncbi:hypothetical protein [Pseudomarimonas salicorniae]|uniref:Uncharacterized protein n=1 Tax=Pseudomarimonas salicorniae TaxID=2933270 RepID=A0ABT0GHK1_9GAMM|nr:hypothetical protein [Lysobacter sp. CAU 1642]MCK7594024.1 hypothetical protein [Lysobacter sp. CAU 1642]